MVKKGYHWSDRLQKYRRPAVRQFMMDRQGVHIILGFIAGALALAAGAATFVLGLWAALYIHPVEPTALGLAVLFLTAALATGGVDWILTHQFLRYEEVEAAEIDDDGYIDIGGYLGGQLGACALYAALTLGLLLWRLL